jgi:hypothetical protein
MGSGDREPPTPSGDVGDEDDSAAADGALPRPSRDPRELAAFALVALVIVGAAAVVVGPVGDTTAADTDGDAATPPPASTTTPTATAESAPNVTMRVRSVEACGTRCRVVTIALTNGGDAPARSVGVTTAITTGDTLVWEGQSDVGRLEAGGTVTRTRTIRVGYVDAARIESNNGRIHIETTVRTANGTRTFTERRTVS